MLKRVSIQNFKSLKDVTLDLQKVNLLIGPNNSGKSNFLKALEYISIYSTGVQKLDSKIDVKGREDLINDFFSKNDLASSNVIFERNIFRYINITVNIENDMIYKYHWEPKTTEVKTYVKGIKEEYLYGKSVVIDEILSLFHQLRIYKPDPNKIALPGPVGIGEEFINADASNIVGFLDLILGKYRKSVFQNIENSLNICLPEFDSINLDDYMSDENATNKLKGKSFKKLGLENTERGITYWADELSEGTLYFLALICIINQPNPPKLLLLEEPEKGIHPRRIWETMRFIFQLAEEKDIQIILTTHNEHVVNAFASMPEAVFVFEKNEEGATEVKNLKRDIIDVSNKNSEENGLEPIDFTSDLGKSWLYGLIGGVPEEII